MASKNIDHDGSGFEEINVQGTKNLCEAAASQGTQRFIYLSSVGVYGHKRHAGNDETTQVKPDTDFSRSKVAAENHVIEYTKNGKFKGIILRHRFVYGEGEQHEIPRMMKAARKYSFLVGRGRARMSFILVKELADIIYRFTKSALPDEENIVYHVNDGEPVSYKEIVFLLSDMFGFKKPKSSIPFWLLHTPVAIYEWLFRIDPEATKSSMSSIRLKLVAQDNYFSNEKLRTLFPDIQLTPLKKALPQLKEYYSQFV